MNSYPMLNFVGRHGGWLAVLAGLLPLIIGVALTVQGASAWWAAGGMTLAIGLFVVVRSYVELVRVMIDMLLPK